MITEHTEQVQQTHVIDTSTLPEGTYTVPDWLVPVKETNVPIEFAEQQLSVFWLADEIKVEKDIQDMRVNLTPAERHGVITTLKLFSLYETHAGDEYWGNRFKSMFDGAEFHRMASVFAMFELAVHQPFYSKINELLYLDTPEFYTSYTQDPDLASRMQHIAEIINDPDDLVSLAGFSMVEGVILYSNFAYLKHFQSQGKNRISNIIRGINFSVRDENIHSQAGAWAFKYKLDKLGGTDGQKQYIKDKIIKLADTLLKHEIAIINKVFALGTQEGINNYQFVDFFQGIGREYNRNWDEDAFVW
jgi:ribonucleoside-diphosphate reductase beta chain